VPRRPEPQRATTPLTNRPAFAGRFFVVLLLFGLPVAASGDLLSDDEPAANGKTPLMTAAREGDAAAVNRLIAAGADVNEANAGGATALMFATLSGDPMVTSLLLRAGARTDSKAKLGWTALALAAVKGYTEVGEVLLDAGASQGVRDAYGWTPLMRAVDRKRIDFVRLLLQKPGADLAIRQEDDATVLHIAAASGDLDIVRLLVAHGADRSARDRNGNTAAEIARSADHTEIAEYLEGAGDS
jgi:ankyrin repeat protein